MKPSGAKGGGKPRSASGKGAGGKGAGRGAGARSSGTGGGSRAGGTGRAGGGPGAGGTGRAGGGPGAGGTGRAGGGSGAARTGSRPTGAQRFGSRGAGRTGAIAAPGSEGKRAAAKTLGGGQVEGRQAVRELLIAGKRRVRELWVSGDLADDDNEGALPDVVADIVEIARSMRVPVERVARKRLDAVARSETPQGIIAFAAELPEASLDDLLARRGNRQPFLVAVDGVTDPGNLGALLRCCDGAGVGGVVLPRHRAVHVTPTAAKSAAGAIEHIPIAVVGGLPAALARIKEAGIWVVGLDDAAERDLFDIGDLATDGICLVMGAEGSGLSRLVRERCDVIVSIPMLGRLSSLNVSAAAALATYEVARHRRSR